MLILRIPIEKQNEKKIKERMNSKSLISTYREGERVQRL